MNISEMVRAAIRGAWRRRVIMVTPLLVLIPLTLVAALFWPPKYQTSALVLLQEYNGLANDVPAYVQAQDMRDKIKGLEALIASEFLLRRVMTKLNPTNARQHPTERDLELYRSRIELRQVGSQFVELTLTGNRSAGLGNELAAILSALFESLLSSEGTSVDATTFVLASQRRKLAALERELAASEPLHRESATTLAQKRTEQANAGVRIGDLEGAVTVEQAALARAVTSEAAGIVPVGASTEAIAAALQAELDRRQKQPTAGETPATPSIATLRRLLDTSRSVTDLSRRLTTARADQAALTTEIGSLTRRLDHHVALGNQIAGLRRTISQFEQRQASSAGAAGTSGAGDIQLLRAPAQMQVIDSPRDPLRRINSRLLILLAGLFIAASTSLAFGVLAERLDDSLRTPTMLAASTGLAVVARLPRLPPLPEPAAEPPAEATEPRPKPGEVTAETGGRAVPAPAPVPVPGPGPVPPAEVGARLDAIAHVTDRRGARSIAFTSPRTSASVDTLCAWLCRSLAAGGSSVLLVEFRDASRSATEVKDGSATCWRPGDDIPRAAITPVAAAGYDHFAIAVTPATRALFNHREHLDRVFTHGFPDHHTIVLALPPVLAEGLVNATSVARAADATFLVCATSRTTNRDARAATDALQAADVTLAGAILDDSATNPPGPDIAARIEKMWLLPPGLRRRLARHLSASDLFT